MKKFVRLSSLMLIFLSIQFEIYAQSNQELDSLKAKLSGFVQVNGTFLDGNNKQTLLFGFADIDFIPKKNKWSFLTSNQYTRVSNFGINNDSDIRNSNWFTFRLQHKVQPQLVVFYENIKRRSLNTRIYGSAGLKFNLLDKANFSFKPAILIGYTYLDFKNNNFIEFDNFTNKEITTWMLTPALQMTAKIPNTNLEMEYLLWYQQDLELATHRRFYARTRWQVQIWKGLSLNFTIINYYANLRLEGVEANDFSLTYGFNYKF